MAGPRSAERAAPHGAHRIVAKRRRGDPHAVAVATAFADDDAPTRPRPAGASAGSSATRTRLVEAATALFAARGFRGTSIRDIAERAGANVAACHYHFGSKEGLYLDVLRGQFALVGRLLERRGVSRSPATLRQASRPELERQLRARVRTMFEVLLGPPPRPHGALMLREMCDPTDALPIIVREFIDPQVREMQTVVARLAPHATAAAVELMVFSIVGQVLFYRFNLPVLLLYIGRRGYPRGFTQRIARHITDFSLAAITALEAAHARGPRPRGIRQQPHARRKRHA